MDQICQELHMSKRTLYELFESKESLLMDCLTEVHRRIRVEHEAALQGSDDVCLMMLFLIRNETSVLSHYARLLNDARHCYPQLTSKVMADFNHQFEQMLTLLFVEASKSGDLREGVDMANSVNLLSRSISYVNSLPDSEAYNEALREVSYTYLRGMLSIDAIRRYDANVGRFQEVIESTTGVYEENV